MGLRRKAEKRKEIEKNRRGKKQLRYGEIANEEMNKRKGEENRSRKAERQRKGNEELGMEDVF